MPAAETAAGPVEPEALSSSPLLKAAKAGVMALAPLTAASASPEATITSVAPEEGPTTGGTEITLTVDIADAQPTFKAVAVNSTVSFAVTTDGKLYAWGDGALYGTTGTGEDCSVTTTYTDAEMLAMYIDDWGYDPTDMTATSDYFADQGWEDPITTPEEGTLAWWAIMYESTGYYNTADNLQYLDDSYGYSSFDEYFDDNWSDYADVTDPLQQIYVMNYDEPHLSQTSTACTEPTLVNGHGDMPLDADIVQIYAGSNNNPMVFAIDADGRVYAWGTNGGGGLGLGSMGSVIYPEPVNITANLTAAGARRIVQIAISSQNGQVLALDKDGQVFGWGSNAYSQTGLPYGPGDGSVGSPVWSPTKILDPLIQHVASDVAITKIAAGGTASYALTDEGHIYAWGSNIYKQKTGNSTGAQADITDVNTGGYYGGMVNGSGVPYNTGCGTYPEFVDMIGLTNGAMAVDVYGQVWVWGTMTDGTAGNGLSTSLTNQACPLNISTMAGAAGSSAIYGKVIVGLYLNAKSSTGQTVYAVDEDGNWYVWGTGADYANLNNGTTGNLLWPQALAVAGTDLDGVEIADLVVNRHALVLGADGELYGWGWNESGQVSSLLDDNVTEPTHLVWPVEWSVESVVLDADGTPAVCEDAEIVDVDAEAGTLTITCTTTAHAAGLVSAQVKLSDSVWTGAADVTASLASAYEYLAPSHTVTFVDGQGNTLKTEQVADGGAASAPPDPTRDGYTFAGWDVAFDHVTGDLTVTALWVKNGEPVVTHTVAFVDGLGNTLKTELVVDGGAATAPSDPTRDGYTFAGWDVAFDHVTGDLTVTAQWTKNADNNTGGNTDGNTGGNTDNNTGGTTGSTTPDTGTGETLVEDGQQPDTTTTDKNTGDTTTSDDTTGDTGDDTGDDTDSDDETDDQTGGGSASALTGGELSQANSLAALAAMLFAAGAVTVTAAARRRWQP
ncbi:MAG: InlB B-repeat-containing protein [Propionibacteriaceae bacterium]|nr:InlB B-repeat-containing protein [Propionibacteriaceae bacterium]